VNGDFPATPEIDGIRFIVMLGCEQDALRSILDVEKLTRRVAGAPAFDERVAVVARIDALLDKRGDDMRGVRVEIIPAGRKG